MEAAHASDDELDDLFDDSTADPVETAKLAPKPAAKVSAAQATRTSSQGEEAGALWDETTMLLRLPKAVSYSARPFDKDTFDLDAEREELMARGKSSEDATAVPPEAVIRWKFDEKETPSSAPAASAPQQASQPQPSTRSNTRIVRWSDGSITLHIGEFSYDVRPSVVGSAGFFLAKRSGKARPVDPDAGGDHPDVEAERASYLESVGVFRHRGALRPLHAPASTRLVLEARSKHSRNTERVRQVELTGDPEKATAEAARRADQMNRAREEERLRAAGLLGESGSRGARGQGGSGGRRARGRVGKGRGANEEGVLYDDEDLGAIRKGVRVSRYEGSEDEDEDEDDIDGDEDEIEGKTGLFEDEDEEEDGEEDEEEDDPEESKKDGGMAASSGGEDEDDNVGPPAQRPRHAPKKQKRKKRRMKHAESSGEGDSDDADGAGDDSLEAEVAALAAALEDE